MCAAAAAAARVFFTRWRLKGRELKINTLLNDEHIHLRGKRERERKKKERIRAGAWTAFFFLSTPRSDEDGAYPMFFVCVCSSFRRDERLFLSPRPASSTLSNLHQKRHPPQSHPSWAAWKEKKNRNDSCSLIGERIPAGSNHSPDSLTASTAAALLSIFCCVGPMMVVVPYYWIEYR